VDLRPETRDAAGIAGSAGPSSLMPIKRAGLRVAGLRSGTLLQVRRNANIDTERYTMIQKGRNTSLNVKDPEAHRLAEAIAHETGETLTRAVTEALRERYERLQKRDPEALAADIRAIAARAAAHIKHPYLDHADYLYDEHGLPK